MARIFSLFVTLALLMMSQPLSAQPAIRIVGSSSVYPFSAAVSEVYRMKGGQTPPIIESTGTGAGFMLFCAPSSHNSPDIVNASRPMKETERHACIQQGITDITEVKLGYDGLVVVQGLHGAPLSLTTQQLYQATAKYIPEKGGMRLNSSTHWDDIDPRFPHIPIILYGPHSGSGKRDAFLEMVMEPSCRTMIQKHLTPRQAKQVSLHDCRLLREDGHFVEVGDNDNLIILKLQYNHQALGIISFSYYKNNHEKIRASSINGRAPTLKTILTGAYPLARPLFMYVRNLQAHRETLLGYVTEFMGDDAISEKGYLAERGLVPLMPRERAAQRRALGIEASGF